MAVFGNYIHESDVDNFPADATDNQKLDVIKRAEQLIEKLTKDFFYRKNFVKTLDGNGKNRLFLGLFPDILLVSKVEMYGIELSTDWWTYDKNSVYLKPDLIGSDLAGLQYRLGAATGLFPKGIGNIVVTGVYGWNVLEMPVAIKKAATMLCQAENDPTLYPEYGGGLKSERLGDYSYTLADSQRFLTGVEAIDKLLRPYIRKKAMLGAV